MSAPMTLEDRRLLFVNQLWDAINSYAIACGGDPSARVYSGTARQRDVAEVGNTVGRAIAEAVAAEREACAKLAESLSPACRCSDHEDQRAKAAEIAAAIRARGNGGS